MIGKRIGERYEILSSVGEGGMSVVYKAKDILLNRLVAVKILREQFTGDEEFIKRFRREAQAAASLSHANIVGIYDVGQEEKLYYLVMEYVEGETLKDVIKEKSPMEEKETIYIAMQICDALMHAHKNALVHRDIKPHNILINKEGIAKVTDFGIARAVSTATVTHTKGILGSVHYFSPEQAKGEIVGEKSDIYSLGIVLYEMVTGKLPFEGESPISIALQHIQKDPVKPRELNPKLNKSLENLILKCMAKDSKDRYESFASIKDDLQLILEGGSIKNSFSGNDNNVSNPSLENTMIFNEKLIVNEDEKVSESEKDTPIKKRKIKPVGIFIAVVFFILVVTGGIWTSAKYFIKEEVVVPDITNKTVLEAKRILNEKDLTIEVKNEIIDAEVPKGDIITQDPLPNAKIKSDRAVKVVISKGPDMVPVPKVTAMSKLEADVKISNSGLSVGEVRNEYSDYALGQVIAQEPKEGEEVLKDSKINLVVSKGPDPNDLSMPALVGLDIDSAEAKIWELDLELGTIEKKPSNEFPKDIVIEQSPKSGSDINLGSEVDLIVSSGPGPDVDQSRVVIKLSRSGLLRIQVSDEDGTKDVYEKYHKKGDIFAKNISYNGQAIISVYLDDEVILQKTEPSDL